LVRETISSAVIGPVTSVVVIRNSSLERRRRAAGAPLVLFHI
jgi:hypothetical protein